jgi:predicted ester cyclase
VATDVETNQVIVRRVFLELFSRDQYAVADELLAPDAIFHVPASVGDPRERIGPEGVIGFLREFKTGFPGTTFTIETLFAQGDFAVARWLSAGQVHRGHYHGIPPTELEFPMTGMSMFQIVDGKIRHIWLELDAYGGVQALGYLPPEGVGPFGLLAWTFRTIGRTARLEIRAKRRGAAG